jgi:hypothetical protein
MLVVLSVYEYIPRASVSALGRVERPEGGRTNS